MAVVDFSVIITLLIINVPKPKCCCVEDSEARVPMSSAPWAEAPPQLFLPPMRAWAGLVVLSSVTARPTPTFPAAQSCGRGALGLCPHSLFSCQLQRPRVQARRGPGEVPGFLGGHTHTAHLPDIRDTQRGFLEQVRLCPNPRSTGRWRQPGRGAWGSGHGRCL